MSQITLNYPNWPQNRPNGNKIYPRIPLQDPPKFTQIGDFGFENMPSGNPVVDGDEPADKCQRKPVGEHPTICCYRCS
jgi:hypothetical protein